jgi:hypothetical protein
MPSRRILKLAISYWRQLRLKLEGSCPVLLYTSEFVVCILTVVTSDSHISMATIARPVAVKGHSDEYNINLPTAAR